MEPRRAGGAPPQPGSDAPRARALAVVALAILAGLAAVEIQNSLRLAPAGTGEGPARWLSRGALSLVALVRPPDRFSSDIQPSLFAAMDLLEGGGRLYGKPSAVGGDFIYPPTAALELAPLGAVAELGGFPLATAVADLLFRVLAIGSMLLAARFLRGVLAGWKAWLLLGLVLYAFYPLRWMLVRVQAQTIVTFLLLAAAAAYGARRDRWAGTLVALAACMKPHLALLLLFGAARRSMRFVRWALAGGVVLAVASLLAAGPEPWRRYVGEVMPRIGRGYAAHANQSPTAAVQRWLGRPAGFETPPPSLTVSIVTAASFTLLLALALWPRKAAATPLARAADFAIAALCLTIASPIAWEHHYAWTIGLFTLTARLLWAGGTEARNGRPPFGRPAALPWLLGLAYVLLGSFWVPFAGASRGLASLAQSLPLAGACLLLVTSWRALAPDRVGSDGAGREAGAERAASGG